MSKTLRGKLLSGLTALVMALSPAFSGVSSCSGGAGATNGYGCVSDDDCKGGRKCNQDTGECYYPLEEYVKEHCKPNFNAPCGEGLPGKYRVEYSTCEDIGSIYQVVGRDDICSQLSGSGCCMDVYVKMEKWDDYACQFMWDDKIVEGNIIDSDSFPNGDYILGCDDGKLLIHEFWYIDLSLSTKECISVAIREGEPEIPPSMKENGCYTAGMF